jgi:hypothetical protein
MDNILNGVKNFNQDLTIWQALSDSLDESVLDYCEDLTPEHIESYLSKKELELREKLKDVNKVTEYKLLSNFRTLKELVLRKAIKDRDYKTKTI